MPLIKKRLFVHLFFASSILCSIDLAAQDKTKIEIKEQPVVVKNGWQEFKSEENGFSADLPKAPEHVTQKITIPKTALTIKYDTYVSEPSDTVVYVVSVWRYPAEIDMSKPEINLQDGFSGMLTALPGSKVQHMQLGDYNGFKQLDFTVKNENIFFQGKLILVHNTLYQVFSVYKESEKDAMQENYSKFIKSFKLINPEQHKIKDSVRNSVKVNVSY